MCYRKMVIYYIYKIHFLCGFPSGRYYIGKHKHSGSLSNDKYTGSGNFCKAYFKKYGKKEGITYIKEILEINPSEEINNKREELLVGDKYKTDPLCMNLIPGGSGITLEKEIAKPVIQYDYCGNLVKEYKSQLEASIAIGLADSSVISKCCISKEGSAGGFIWRFKENPLDKKEIKNIKRKLKIRSIPIIQYDLKGNEINRYNSIKEAANKNKLSTSSIAGCCNKLKSRNESNGFIWRYFDDPLSDEEINKLKFNRPRCVLQYNSDGILISKYNTLTDAGRSVNKPFQNIQAACNAKYGTCAGYIWRDENNPLNIEELYKFKFIGSKK